MRGPKILISILLVSLFFGFNKSVAAIQPKYYGECFNEAAKLYGIPPKLLIAIAKVESNFNPYAINVNKDGKSIKVYYPQNKEQAYIVLNYLASHGYNYDVGIAQINVINIKDMGLDQYKLLDPCYNLEVSAKILKTLIQRYGLTWQAIWHYNGRPSYSYLVYHALIWLNNRPNYYVFGNP